MGESRNHDSDRSKKPMGVQVLRDLLVMLVLLGSSIVAGSVAGYFMVSWIASSSLVALSTLSTTLLTAVFALRTRRILRAQADLLASNLSGVHSKGTQTRTKVKRFDDALKAICCVFPGKYRREVMDECVDEIVMDYARALSLKPKGWKLRWVRVGFFFRALNLLFMGVVVAVKSKLGNAAVAAIAFIFGKSVVGTLRTIFASIFGRLP